MRALMARPPCARVISPETRVSWPSQPFSQRSTSSSETPVSGISTLTMSPQLRLQEGGGFRGALRALQGRRGGEGVRARPRGLFAFLGLARQSLDQTALGHARLPFKAKLDAADVAPATLIVPLATSAGRAPK